MSPFDAGQIVNELEASGLALVDALRSTRPDQAKLRPEPNRWSILEIAAHLVDEEREDFRARLRSTLEDHQRAWPPIDPERWVLDRDYASKSFEATIDEFERERAMSLGWLASLVQTDWTTAYTHPKLGALRAGDLLAAWAAHDLLHHAQVQRTRARLIDAEVAPFHTRYAQP